MFLLNLCQETLRFKHISVMACSLNDCSDRHYDYLGRICIFAQYSFFCTRFYEQLAASEVVRHLRGGSPRGCPPPQRWFARCLSLPVFDNSLRFL